MYSIIRTLYFLYIPQLIRSSAEAGHCTEIQDLQTLGACDGDYDQQYETLFPLGKGAFGFVWSAKHKEDAKEVSLCK